MPGLSFSNQQSQRRTSFWWVPLVLIVISVMLITLCVRFDNGGAFAVARNAVQTVTKPIETVCSGLSAPFDKIGTIGEDERVEQLETENQQLRTLVAELEEYRQRSQRLEMLVQLSDTYDLENISADVINTTVGWDRTATLNKGSDDGIEVGMGVISSCGLYGQIESVTATTSVVRLINDANSSVSAMVQNSRASGILYGAYDGTLTLEYVSVDKSVGEGDIVITSGQGGTYPRGIIIGTVRTVEIDSSKLYYRLTIEPIFSLESCEEVLVLTGNESETQSVLDLDLLESVLASTPLTSVATSTEDATSISTTDTTDASVQTGETAAQEDAAQTGQAGSEADVVAEEDDVGE